MIVDSTSEDTALKRNMQNNIAQHLKAKVHFLTNKECLESIAQMTGQNTPSLELWCK